MKIHQILREPVRLIIKTFFGRRYNTIISTENFDIKRKKPYFLVSNHQLLDDPLLIGMNLSYYPYPIASNVLYTSPMLKFALTVLLKSIPKRKGQTDTNTIRQIIRAFNHDKRGIQICPEGNTSFYGEQTPTDYTATAKLIKKLKHDLVVGQFRGGYLAYPRWADQIRKKSPIYLHYKLLVKGEDLETHTVSDLAKLLEKEIAFNDHEWNEKAHITYKHKHKAEGIENVLYGCPKCHEIQTISSKGNDIYCKYCGKIASLDEHQSLVSKHVKNTIEWGRLQKEWLKNHIDDTFASQGKFYELLLEKQKRKLIHKKAHIQLTKDALTVKYKKTEYRININDLTGITLTQQNKISFDDNDKTYLLQMDDSKLYLDLIKLKKGEQQ